MDFIRFRICASYVITTLLLTGFIYMLLSTNVRNAHKISQLRGDFETLQSSLNLPESSSDGCIGPVKPEKLKATNCPSSPAAGCDNREINNIVDSLVTRKMTSVLAEMHNIKKQLIGDGCGAAASDTKTKTCSGGGVGSGGGTASVAVAKDRVNFASEELGARIISVAAKPVGGTNIVKTVLGLDFSANAPVNMLRSSMAAGNCFAFKGSKAVVTIQLSQEVVVESVGISHVSKEQTPFICTSSAPKAFTVFGVPSKDQGGFSKKVNCGEFQFDNEPKKRTQEFPLKMKQKFSSLIFSFNSNHGHPNYTCIYRIEAFGKPCNLLTPKKE